MPTVENKNMTEQEINEAAEKIIHNLLEEAALNWIKANAEIQEEGESK